MSWVAPAIGAGLGALGGIFGQRGPSTTRQHYGLPDHLRNAGIGLTEDARALAGRAYNPYAGDRVADAAGGTGAGAYDISNPLGSLRGLRGTRLSGRSAIENIVNQGVPTYGGTGGRIADDLVGQGGKYFNEYLDDTLGRSQVRIQRTADEQQRNIGARFANQGGYSGTARSVASGHANRAALDAQADLEAQMGSRAFERSQDLAFRDRDVALSREGLEAEAGRQGIAGAQTEGDLARTADMLGLQGLESDRALVGDQMRGESYLRDISQAQATADYDDYLYGNEFKKNDYGWLSGILAQTPHERTVTGTTQPGQSSFLGNLFGGAAGGAALGASFDFGNSRQAGGGSLFGPLSGSVNDNGMNYGLDASGKARRRSRAQTGTAGTDWRALRGQWG